MNIPLDEWLGAKATDGGKGLSMTATFRGHEERHLVVHGDAKVPGRFVGVNVGVNVAVDKGSGGMEGVELMLSAL